MNGNKKPSIARYGDYIGLGIQIAASMVLPLLGGIWLDNYLDLSPWFTITGALLGVLSVFVTIFKLAVMANRDSDRDRAKRPPEI